MVVNEIVTEFSFKGNSKPLEEFNKSLSTSITAVAGLGAATVAAAGAFVAWTSHILDGLDPMIQLSRSTGVAIESIQALGYAASVSGSSSQAMESTINSLSKTIGNAAQLGDDNFARLGISVRKANGEVKSADEVLMEVGKRFSELHLSMQEKQSIAASLGIDPSLIQLLSESGDQIEKLTNRAKQYGVITKSQADNAAAFNDALTTLKFAFTAVQNQIAVGFAPQLKALADRFMDFLKANQDLIKNGISWLGEALTTLAGTVVRLAPVFGIMVAGFLAAKVAALGFGGVMDVVLSPVVLITAGIVALLLIIDDLMVAMEGGQSVIADFFKKFFGIDIVPILKGIVHGVKEMVSGIIKLVDPLIGYFKNSFMAMFSLLTGNFDGFTSYANKAFSDLGKFFQTAFYGPIKAVLEMFKWASDGILGAFGKAFNNIKELASPMVDGIMSAISPLIKFFTYAFKAVFSLITGDFDGFIDNMKNAINNLIEYFKKAFSIIGNSIKNIIPDSLKTFSSIGDSVKGIVPDSVKSFFGFGGDDKKVEGDQKLSPQDTLPHQYTTIGGASNTSISNSVKQDVNINITSPNPEAAGKSVKDNLQQQIDNAQTQSKRGGI